MPHANCPLLFALCHSPFGLSLASRHLYLTSFGTSLGLRPSFASLSFASRHLYLTAFGTSFGLRPSFVSLSFNSTRINADFQPRIYAELETLNAEPPIPFDLLIKILIMALQHIRKTVIFIMARR